MNLLSTGLKLEDGTLVILDQTQLPHKEIWLKCESPSEMASYIRELKVRGAPLIGVAAALSLALYAKKVSREKLEDAARELRAARPTAVNLMWAVDITVLNASDLAAEAVMQRAVKVFEDDVAQCREMAEAGKNFFSDGDHVLTHCNTGGLATAGTGTALGVIRAAFEQGKKIHVFVDETRPLLQGARLTAWELSKLHIPYTLICDNMAGFLMSRNKVQKVITGADRIAMNGDFANKVGTYSLAVLAEHHGIPFYVAAPETTVDKNCPNGEAIPIEERSPDEVRRDWSPSSSSVYNPSFDITPGSLVTAFIGPKSLGHKSTHILT